MKIVVQDKVVSLVTGQQEIEILLGLLTTCLRSFPVVEDPHIKNDRWSDDRRRIQDMHRKLMAYLGMTKSPDGKVIAHHTIPKDTPCPFCLKTLRGKSGLEKHLQNVHAKEGEI